MSRVMVFGKSQRKTRKVPHITRAFKDLGHDTLWLNPASIKRWMGRWSDSYILNRVYSFNPDIIFIFSQDIPLPVLEKISADKKIKIVLFYVDWRPEILPTLIERGKLVDLFLVTSKGLLEEYCQAGIRNPVYLTDACDTYDHKRQTPILPIWKSEVAFIGEARPNESRVNIISRLKEICSVKVYGNNWEDFHIQPTLKSVGPRGYRLICGGAKIILGSDIVNFVDGYWSNRLWLSLGCGGFLLTNYVRGIEDLFQNREHLVWYHDEEECFALVKEFLAKPEERKRIANTGYIYVHEHHTFHHFASKVLTICDTIQKGE